MEEHDVRDYFEKVEQRYGGPVHFKTFASFYRITEGKVTHTSGLLCIVHEHIYFEDFERSGNTLLNLFTTGKKKPEYTKFIIDRPISKVETCFQIPSSVSQTFLQGRIHRDQLQPSTRMQRIVSKSRLYIRFSDQTDWVVDPLDPKKFIDALEERR